MDYLSLDAASSGCSSDAEQLLDDLERIFPLDPEDLDRELQRDPVPVSTSSPTEERRRRHREGMARLRTQRRANIQRLETQAKTLHLRLRKALKWIDGHRAHHQARECRCLAYSELVSAAEALLEERYTLEDELHFRERYARLVRNDAARCVEEETMAHDGALSTVNERGGYWVRFAENEPPLFYDYEPVEQCTATIRASLRAIASVYESFAQGDAQPTHCLGWQVEHVLTGLSDHEKPCLRYRFSRRVSRHCTTLKELEDRTWTMLRTPQLLARMYGSAVIAKVVQTVSDDAFILLRNSPERSHHKRYRFFSLATRLWSADRNSVTVVKALLPKQPRQMDLEQRHCLPAEITNDNEVVWLRSGVSSFQFSETTDGAIRVEYLGFIECVDRGHALHLVTETCLALLRWEQFVVPPRLLT